jgi:ssRNA-specific RNase YbeY (16S rRNA maturation enzyme)
MCNKGYQRITELETHENGYDHQHRKRMKEMKQITRNPTAAVRNSRSEKKRT